MAKEEPQPTTGGSLPEQLARAATEAITQQQKPQETPPRQQKSKSKVNSGILELSDKEVFHNPNAQRIYDEIIGDARKIGDANNASAIRIMCEEAIRQGHASGEDALVFQEIIQNCEEVIRNAYVREGTKDRFSSIYLSEEEIKAITENPALWFDRKLRQLELHADDPESILFTSSKRRLELAAEFFGSESFDKSRVLLDPRMSDQSVDMLKKHVETYAGNPTKSKLADLISSRIDAVFVQAHLSRATMQDMPKVVNSIRSMGDKGLSTLESYDAALVGEWRGRYDKIVLDLMKGRRFTPSVLDEASEIAFEQLMSEKHLVEPRIQRFYQLWQAQGTEPVKFELSDDYAKAIIARSRIAWRVRMNQAKAMASGEGPLFGDKHGDIPSFATMNIEEVMLASSRIRDWFIRKWGKKVMLPMWNMGAKFTAQLSPELNGKNGLISQKTEELWHNAHQSADRESQLRAMRQIKDLMDNNTLDGSGIHGNPTDQELIDQMNKRMRLQSGFHKKALHELVEIEEGGERMQYMLRPYFHWDSDWRRRLAETYVKMAYTHADDYCLGSELKKAGNTYFFDPTQREHAEHIAAGKTFEKALMHVVRFRPQALAEMLSDGQSTSFASWFKNHQVELGYRDAKDPNAMFADLNRRFLMINNSIMMNNLPPIDYSNLDTFIEISHLPSDQRATRIAQLPEDQQKQWEQVSTVFSVFEKGENRAPLDNPEQYFKTMKSLHGMLTENTNKQLFELKGIQYDKFFLSLAWEDDIPTQYLEDPTQFVQHINKKYLVSIGVLREGEEPPKHFSLFNPTENTPEENAFVQRLLSASGISEQFTQLGVGPGSPLARAWGDYTLAGDAFGAILENGFNPDEKEFFKMIKTVWTKVEMYQGAQLATDAGLKLGAAWIGSAQVDVNYGDFLTSFADSSVLKKVWGNNAPSLSLDSVMEMRENLEKIMPLMENMSPAAARQLNRFLRLSTVHILGKFDTGISWESLINPFGIASRLGLKPDKLIRRLERTMPMGLGDYKFRMVLTLVFIMLTLASLNEAKKGGKEGTSSGGGH